MGGGEPGESDFQQLGQCRSGTLGVQPLEYAEIWSRSMTINFLAWALTLSVVGTHGMQAETNIKKEPFGRTPDNGIADLYTLANRHGMQAAITTYGGTRAQCVWPDP